MLALIFRGERNVTLESVADLHALVGRARAGNPYALVRGSDEETCLPVV